MVKLVYNTHIMESKRHQGRVSAFDKRIHEIDFLRGFLIILVVMDHIFWNLGHYSGPTLWNISWMHGFFYKFYWEGIPRMVIQPLALMAFCFVSGISSAFSKNNWKRAIETLIVWAVIAIATNILQATKLFGDRNMRIDFNIIGVLGFSMLFYCLIQNRSWKALLAGVLICFLISQYLIPDLSRILIALCGSHDIIHAGHVFTYPNFYFPLFFEPLGQADFVPLLPFMMFFFIGALVSYFVYKERKKSILPFKFNWEKPVCFLGRHTLIIYMVHMFIITGIFTLINLIIGG